MISIAPFHVVSISDWLKVNEVMKRKAAANIVLVLIGLFVFLPAEKTGVV